MHVIGHDYEIARGEKRIAGMDAPPKSRHRFSDRGHLHAPAGAGRCASACHRHDAREHWPPPLNGGGEKEEAEPILVELEMHTAILPKPRRLDNRAHVAAEGVRALPKWFGACRRGSGPAEGVRGLPKGFGGNLPRPLAVKTPQPNLTLPSP